MCQIGKDKLRHTFSVSDTCRVLYGAFFFLKMDIVSFETAVRLKEAGFPKPGFEQDQLWYDGKKYIILIRKYLEGKDGNLIGRYLNYGSWEHLYDIVEHVIFAPTTTDILREFDTIVSFRPYVDVVRGHVWDCTYFKSGPAKDGNWFQHQGENAVEVVAAAWLDYQTRKNA